MGLVLVYAHLRHLRSPQTRFAHISRHDGRTNVERITKKDRPLTAKHFAEFEKCYGKDPNGKAKRSPKRSKEDRWRKFHITEVQQCGFKIDSLKWLRDESLEDASHLPPPEELATEAISELESAIEELNAVLTALESESSELPHPRGEGRGGGQGSPRPSGEREG